MEEGFKMSEFKSPFRSSLSYVKRIERKAQVTEKGDGYDEANITHLFTANKKQHENVSCRTSDTQSEISQLSSDVIFTDRKTSIETPSKTDSKSYKDKIRDRFKMIREKAGKSTRKAKFKDTARMFILEKIRKENEELEKRIRAQTTTVKRSPKGSEINFFTCNKESSAETLDVVDCAQHDSTEHLIDKNLVQFEKSVNLKFEISEAEREWLFKPDGKSVDVTRKLRSTQPICLEDEGIFVPETPKISQKRINILEQRLLGIDDKKWFNYEGKLDFMENPISGSSMRPYHDNEKNLTIFTTPKADNVEFEDILVIKENILHLNLKSLKFNHHPLFSLEHVLERQLIKVCEKYERHQTNNTFKKLNNRLETTRQVLQSMQKNDENDDSAIEYKNEIKDLRERVFTQGKEERQLLKYALNLWNNIKKLRSANGYATTSIKLVINKEPPTEEEKRKYEENLLETFREVLAENRMKLNKKLLQDSECNSESSDDDDEDAIYDEVKMKFTESFKSPSESFIRLTLTNDHQKTETVENNREKQRRSAVATIKIQLVIICNKLKVCRTNIVSLSDDFECVFDEKISIMLTEVPKFITVVIIEQTNILQKKKLAELNLNIPHRSIHKGNSKINHQKFEKTEKLTYRHAGVGSDINIKSILTKNDLKTKSVIDEDLTTSGVFFYALFWDDSTKYSSNASPVRDTDIVDDVIDKFGFVVDSKLTEWMDKSNIDPQNPKNSVLYQYIEDFGDDIVVPHEKNYFRLSPHSKSSEFCDVSEIDQNIRMKILRLRDRNEPEFDGMLVPLRTREIPSGVFDDYKRRIARERNDFSGNEDAEEESDGFDGRRRIGARNLKRMHVRIFQECKSAKNNLKYEDVVDEKYLAHFERFIRMLSTSFLNWFQWKSIPQLVDTSPKMLEPSNITNLSQSIKICFRIKNAINLPQRDFSTDDSYKLNSFVEVTYNESSNRTKVMEGTAPIWNEDLHLSLDSSHSNYLNPSSLNGCISVNVYDEIRNGEIKTKNWLGTIDVPLSALCFENGLRGYFKLDPPYIMFGYNEHETTYLNLEICLQPAVPKLSPSTNELPSCDLPYIKDYIINWNESFNNAFPSRAFSAMVLNSGGKTCCVVRYIKALEPPQLNNEGFDVDVEQCAKFVSLIPFTTCNHFYQNMWLSTDQLLKLLLGSVIDHAVALTCFLLALKLDVWLLLGFGLPQGPTAYVLLREQSKENFPHFYIIDVKSGDKIDILDPYCPLQKIYCLLNSQNLWANTQKTDNLAFTRFDLSRRSDWLPLFNNDFTAPNNSVHNQIEYIPREKTDELEIRLEKKIRKFIFKSRPTHRTRWNKKVSTVLKQNIHLLDYVYMHGRSNQDVWNEITRHVSNWNVYGYIIALPYTNFSGLLKKIKAFGVYNHDDPDGEFSLAVKLQALPNYIASVWIFLATVEEKL